MALGIILLFVGTVAPPSINGDLIETNNEKNASEYQDISSIINESLLDLQFIYNITENLSNIIFTQYDESAGEIAKGRDFGTKGDHEAARILEENMTKIGLWTWREPIKNTPVTLSEVTTKIGSKVEILEKGLTVKKISDRSLTPVTECYFSSRSNLTGASICPLTVDIISRIFRVNGILDENYHLYDGERLTHNFSYTNLRVIRKPYFYSLPTEFLRQYINKEDFVYIAKDTDYCNWLEPPPGLTFGPLLKFLNNKFQFLPPLYFEMGLWTFLQPYCRGLILIDSNNDTFNCGPGVYTPLPTIRINGSLGRKIFDNPDDYRLDFYMNQQWIESVESYNVIGQINGTNRNETVIVSCLYDCQWNQGTADSAIGMAVVLGVAKYMKEQNITPRCNVRFIGFSGEEHGLRGAYYYEALHKDEAENISMVIDLNQLGFNWTKTRLTLLIVTNNESLKSTISDVANRTDYVNRTGNVTNFDTWFYGDDCIISNAQVFAKAKKLSNRSYNTILFVKKGQWYFHHRDGMNHLEGDVITYFDWLDTSVTGEMVWNVTKYFTVNESLD